MGRLTVVLLSLILLFLLVLPLSVQAEDEDGRKLENPIPRSSESVTKGKGLFRKYCRECHGPKGDGNSDMVDFLSTPPADLTDDEWQHGSTDGEIFVVIRDGVSEDMEPWDERLSEEEIWHLVNFLKTLSAKPEQ